MKTYKYYFSISLLMIVCAIVGGLIYSQTGVAKSKDEKIAEVAATTELLSYESANFNDNQIATHQAPHSEKIISDANTKLFLNFDSSLIGEQGEAPLSSSGFSYQTGIQNQSVFLGNPNQLTYSSQDNINALEGTFEFWIKPNWNGNDGVKRTILKWGDAGGILFNKDVNSLRVIFNRFGTTNEKDITFDISNWQADNWYFVAFTYSNINKSFKIFINGELKNSKIFTGDLPNITANNFKIGSDSTDYLFAQLDNFTISNVARSEQEISQTYLNYLFSSLTLNPSPVVGGQITTGTISLINPTLNDLTVSVSSSDASVLSVPPVVTIPANARSATFPINTNAVANTVSVTITATSANKSINAQINVVPPCQTTLPPQIISLWSGNDNGLDTVGSANQNWSSFGDGKVGRAFSFSLNDRFSTGFSKSVQEVPNFTFEAWIRPTSLNGSILDDTDGANRRSKSIALSNGIFQIGRISSGISTNFSADLNQWQHIAYVITPTTIYFYKNGVQFSTPNTYNSILRNPGTELYIGRNFESSFVGQIDEPAMYSRALSHAEIQAIYNTGSLGKCYTSELQSLTINPTGVETGSTATGTITLASIAPVNGAQVSLINSDETLATIPASVTIPAGETQITFPITTLPSTRIKILNINGVYQSSVRSGFLTVGSLPDLQVDSVNSPIEASTGTAFSVNAQFTNAGTGVAEGILINFGTYAHTLWEDHIYFSRDNQVGDDIRIGFLSSSSNTLQPNQNYTQNFTVTIPSSAIIQDGDYYIYIKTNAGFGQSGVVRNERDYNNNVTFRPIRVLYKAADLQVNGVNTPTETDTGTPFNISWSDTNAGTLATGGYSDEVYFSIDNQVGNDVSLKSISQLTLELNQTRAFTATVTIPTTAVSQDGDYFVYIKTDSSNIVSESNENNNIVFRPIRVLYRVPDLQVNNLNAPTEIGGGTQFSLTWNDVNSGTGRANPSWNDQIFFSRDNQIGSDILLGTVSQLTAIEANQSAAKNLNVTIPRTAITQDGDYYIYVRTDSGNSVSESNETNNITFRPIRVYITFPDLQAVNLSTPPLVNFDVPFEFSWSDRNAGNRAAIGPWRDKLYISTNPQIDANDFVVGEFEFTETINPNESLVRTRTLTIPSNQGILDGTLYLIVQTDSTNAVFEDTKENNNTAFVALAPDLQITASTAPTQSDTDSNFNVSWTDRNFGNRTANPTWTDRILLSTDNLPSGNDTILGDFPFANPLTPTSSADRIQTISIPRSAVGQDGNYFLIIQTDANNNINEVGNENNNFVAKPITVRKTPLPDLTIQNITAPDNAFFGQTIRIQWTVRNIGNGPTNAAEWQDWIYLSSDDVPELQDPFKAPLQNISYLAAGENYTASADITIPIGVIGSYKILVYTDSNGVNLPGNIFSVRESNELNNWNNARTIQINAPPLPDLQTTLVQAQEEAFAGQPMNLNWRVENRGDGTTPPTIPAWNDKIYLSQNTTFEPNIDRLIGSRQRDGALAATQGYSVNSYSVTLPNDIAGNWYVFVVADADNQIFEFGNENNNSNYDREQPGSPMLIRATPPDLIVPNVINSPNNGNAAGQITVGWTVRNQGAFDAAPNWFDTVYLSSDDTLDKTTDTPLGTIARSNPLGAGLTYDATANVTLPACISGNYYLFVVTDSRRQIFEYDPKVNAESNNTSAARQISITNSPADLRVTTVANPVSGVAGQPAAFSWTVANQGIGTTLNTVWNDDVYLSPTSEFVRANSTRIGAFTHTGALAVGGSYSQTQNIVIPNTAQGNYYVFVLTDANDNVEECGASNGNNFEGSSTVFNVSNSLPDLTVSNFAFVNNFIAGQNVNVTWTVSNNGTAAAQNSSWGDSVYFSTNNTLDENDRKLTDVIVEGGLAPNATYTKDAQVLLPIVAPGSYFLIVNADNGNNVFEGQGENNNIRTLVLPIDVPPVDLQVTAVNSSATVFSGQTTMIDWTIQNTGSDQTVGANWTDAVVLSLDQIDDPTDRVIGYLQHEGAIGGGASYNATTDVFVPSGLAGQYYIFIRADRNNQLAESSETNNSSGARAISLQLAPPADLIITNVVGPTSASPGESATFNWTVQNTGANPAIGLWTDTVYLSTDQTWDIGDVLVGRQTAGVNVAPGQTYNGTLSTTLPAVNLGNYYVIIRTDIRNRVIETNENNNSGASGGTTTVDVPALQFGVPQSTTLVTGQERFYKFNAPASETVRVSLDGQDGSSNELYTRFGQMASRNAYDFLFDRLYESDQELTIPNTSTGNYYNLIRGDSVSISATKTSNQKDKQPVKLQSQTSENISIKAEVLPFGASRIVPTQGGNVGKVTVTINGSKFTDVINNSSVFGGTKIRLVKGQNEIFPVWAKKTGNNEIVATFDLANAEVGIYDLKTSLEGFEQYIDPIDGISKGRRVIFSESRLQNSFEILSGGGPQLNYKLHLPSSARIGSKYGILLEISNNGTNDVEIPLLQITSPNDIPLDSTLEFVGSNSPNQIQVLVIGKARETILAPKEKVLAQLYAYAPSQNRATYKVQNMAELNDDVINWDLLESYYQSRVSYENWSETWTNFKILVGVNWATFQQAMRQIALENGKPDETSYYIGEDLILMMLSKASLGETSFTNSYDNFHQNHMEKVSVTNIPIYKSLLQSPSDSTYCVYADTVQLAEDTNYIGLITLPGVRWWFDNNADISEIWENRYINGIGGSVTRNENSPLSNIARNTPETQDWFNQIRRHVNKRLRLSDDLCQISSPKQYRIEELLKQDDLYVGKETGPILQAPVEWSFSQSPFGFLVGGKGFGDAGPDTRRVTGTITLTPKKDCKGNIIGLDTEYNLDFAVHDTVDNCPGGDGGIKGYFGGVPELQRLETARYLGGFNDVQLDVRFKIKKKTHTGLFKKCRQNPCQRLGSASNCPLKDKCQDRCPGNNSGGGAGSGSCGCEGNDCYGHPLNRPSDPNDKVSPAGFGEEKFVASRSLMPYTINFENIPTATASAQRIRVTDQLDSNVDPRTFRLKEIGFGSYRLQVPENRAFFQQRVQLGAEFNNLLADISAGVDISTGKVTWTLTAIDPATGEQPNSANLGLLAPNDETGRGQGFVTYTVRPKQNATTGTVISNNATIIFDTEEPITTNTVTNTLDADLPTSAVNALPAYQSNPIFTVSWAGTDAANGSGLQNYDIWVAEDDGAYQPFVSGTTDTSATFTGQLGKIYRFYSIARDNAGNLEVAPAAPDTITRIFAPTAASVTLSGRVTTNSGTAISRAILTLTNQQGISRTATTNTFGYFRFTEVPAGETYVISVNHRRYQFETPTQILSVMEDTNSINFKGDER